MLIILFMFLLYFVPAMVAMGRRCKSFAGIALTNLAFGWTFVGWWVALIWAVTGETLETVEASTTGYTITGQRY